MCMDAIRSGCFIGLLMVTGCQSTPAVSPSHPIAGVSLQSERSIAAAHQAYQVGDLLSAEALLQHHLQSHPQDPDGWFLLGNIYLRTAQYQAAQRAYAQASQLRPAQPEIWHNLALVHLRQATHMLLEGQLHHDHSYEPLLGWLLHMQGASQP